MGDGRRKKGEEIQTDLSAPAGGTVIMADEPFGGHYYDVP
jgi:hypothetical protein